MSPDNKLGKHSGQMACHYVLARYKVPFLGQTVSDNPDMM